MNLFQEVAEFKKTAEELYNLELDVQTLADTLESARFPVEQKAVNVAMVIRNFEAHSAAIKAQEEAMAARRKASDKRAAWLKEYLLSSMLAAGIRTVESPYFKLSIAKNPGAVVVDCESVIPADYFRQPETPPPVLDKNLIKQAIKDGYDVPGVHIEQSERLEIK